MTQAGLIRAVSPAPTSATRAAPVLRRPAQDVGEFKASAGDHRRPPAMAWALDRISVLPSAPAPVVQTKLRVGSSRDPLEREADAMADQVMRASDTPPRQPDERPRSVGAGDAQHRCASGNGHETPIVRRSAFTPSGITVPSPPIVHAALSSPGSPLDANVRQFMEPRFGHDFSRVRVHTNAMATASARQLNARAYTVGSSIVFGDGQYAPGTSAGRHLLAHELAHTVQQERVGTALVQRAEVDDSEGWCPVLDIGDSLNAAVNARLAEARTEVPKYAGEDKQKFLVAAYDRLLVMESWAYSLHRANKPSGQSGTKYEGTTEPGPLAAAVKVAGICIGNDKIGHFFMDGWNAAKADDDRTAYLRGVDDELGKHGLADTGVFSNADLVANLAGRKFWLSLKEQPDMEFKIAEYVTKQWNETKNVSYYRPDVAEVVWPNLLKGPWSGSIKGPGDRTGTVDISFDGGISGTYTETSHPDESDPWRQTLTKSGDFSGDLTAHTMPLTGANETDEAVYGITLQITLHMEQGPDRVIELVSDGERILTGSWNEDDSGDAEEKGSLSLQKS